MESTRKLPFGHSTSPASATAVALIVAVTVTALVVGLRTGYRQMDVDEIVFRDAIRGMKAGESYYPAMRDALMLKEGAPPDEVRAIRPPTLFLVLRWLPERSWRWVVAVVFAGIAVGAWRIGAPYGRWGGGGAVALAGLWLVSASPLLFLHAELWGAPLFMAGLLALRREGGDRRAVWLIAGATVIRELFGLGLLIGMVSRPHRRKPWAAAIIAVTGLAVVHVLLARRVLSPAGGEVALGNERRTVSFVLTLLGPGNRPAAWVLGVLLLAVGGAGMIRRRVSDPAAGVLLPFTLIMIPAGIWATRVYWSLTWGPAVAAFVPAALFASSSPNGRARYTRRPIMRPRWKTR